MLRRTFVAGTAAAATAGPLAARAQTTRSLKTIQLSVGGASLLTYLPMTIANRLNYYRDEGLAVNVNDFAGGAKSVEALVGGSVDIMCAAFEHTCLLQPKGINLTAVALLSTSYGAVIGLTKKASANYKTPADLKGMKFGVTAPGSSSALALTLLEAKAGLPKDSIAMIGMGSGAGALAMARSGQLDGISNFDPVVSELVRSGDIVPIVDTRTRKGIDYLYGGTITGSAISAKSQYIQDHKDTIQSFVNAIVRALKWLQHATPEEVAATVPPEFYGPDRDLYMQSFSATRPLYSPTGTFTISEVNHLFRVLSTIGPLVGAHVDLLRTFDNSFATAANARFH